MRSSDITIIVDYAESEDPLYTAEIQTPLGTMEVMAEVIPHERSLEVNGMHVYGGSTKWGPKGLMQIAQAVMEQMDVDEIVVLGGVRTTGANPGRDPRPRRFRRASQPPEA